MVQNVRFFNLPIDHQSNAPTLIICKNGYQKLVISVDKWGTYEDNITGRQCIDLALKQPGESVWSCLKFNKAAKPQNTSAKHLWIITNTKSRTSRCWQLHFVSQFTYTSMRTVISCKTLIQTVKSRHVTKFNWRSPLKSIFTLIEIPKRESFPTFQSHSQNNHLRTLRQNTKCNQRINQLSLLQWAQLNIQNCGSSIKHQWNCAAADGSKDSGAAFLLIFAWKMHKNLLQNCGQQETADA